jgi:hypothetical protein
MLGSEDAGQDVVTKMGSTLGHDVMQQMAVIQSKSRLLCPKTMEINAQQYKQRMSFEANEGPTMETHPFQRKL